MKREPPSPGVTAMGGVCGIYSIMYFAIYVCSRLNYIYEILLTNNEFPESSLQLAKESQGPSLLLLLAIICGMVFLTVLFDRMSRCFHRMFPNQSRGQSAGTSSPDIIDDMLHRGSVEINAAVEEMRDRHHRKMRQSEDEAIQAEAKERMRERLRKEERAASAPTPPPATPVKQTATEVEIPLSTVVTVMMSAAEIEAEDLRRFRESSKK